MKVHLIGGFLGSGKTTAITQAARILSAQGRITGIITNDQGKYLVDTEYLRSLGIPNGQVTGGCFCCNYEALADQIDALQNQCDPQFIFAESVGSCTDLLATVLKPLVRFKESVSHVTFTTLVDALLLNDYLENGRLPFHDDTNYIWQKQIEESEILIVNKIDQLDAAALQSVEQMARRNFADKILLFQTSLEEQSVNNWLEILDRQPAERNHATLEIDYEKYAAGEANLAWLDESIDIYVYDGSAPRVAREFITGFIESAKSKEMRVGHLKFMFESADKAHKISITSPGDLSENIDFETGSQHAHLVVNARIQTSPDLLRRMVAGLLNGLRVRFNAEIRESNVSFFKPSYPRPTHRLV